MIQNITKGITTAALAVLIGLSAAACDDEGNPNPTGGTAGSGGNGGSGGDGGSGGSGGSSQGEQYVDAVCGKLFECCNAADLVARVGNSGIVDYAGCRVLYRTFWEGGYEPMMAEAEAAGRAEFDDAAFAACLDAMEAQPCGEFATGGSVGCDNFIIGKVDTGSACTQSFECTSKKCEVASGAAMGTCVDPAPAAEGAACDDDDDCAEGLYCEITGTDVCAKKKADSEACTNNAQCVNNACVADANGMKTCATICQGGGPGPGDIDAALESVGGTVVQAMCRRSFECCTEQELDASLFDNKAECGLLYGAFLGVRLVEIHNDLVEGRVSVDAEKLVACVQTFDMLTCEESAGNGFTCTDAIKGLVADGQSCTDSGQCTSTFCNVPAGAPMGTCATPPGAGAPCTDECAETFYCSAGTCASQKMVGATCNVNNECLEGDCVADGMGVKTCTLVCDGI